MNIAVFGDSYVDRFQGHPIDIHPSAISRHQKIWIQRLSEDLGIPLINSGKAGSPLFYAIKEWIQCHDQDDKNIEFAVWTLTWHQRLYVHQHTDYTMVNAPDGSNAGTNTVLSNSVELYKHHIYDEYYMQFIYDRMVEWVLQLPRHYPKIKFIFIANNAFALSTAKKYFTQGVLLDFAFEQISALEGEDVTYGPWSNTKFGHMTDVNHERFKNFVKPIFLDYEQHRNCVLPVDLVQFAV